MYQKTATNTKYLSDLVHLQKCNKIHNPQNKKLAEFVQFRQVPFRQVSFRHDFIQTTSFRQVLKVYFGAILTFKKMELGYYIDGILFQIRFNNLKK